MDLSETTDPIAATANSPGGDSSARLTAQALEARTKTGEHQRDSIVVVVPCYNEGARLDDDALDELLRLAPQLSLMLVDDGSSDNTGQRLQAFAARHPKRVDVLSLADNRGKAEAVRLGLIAAARQRPEFVGYLDADMATPPSELVRLYAIACNQDKDVVIGSRVALLGRCVERSPLRHVLGRAFATGAALILGMPLYDTQCGAKVFRRTDALAEVLLESFASRWAFDVELLGRLLIASQPDGAERIVEEPLRSWTDMPGSKLRPTQMLRVAADLSLIAQKLRRRRIHARPNAAAP